MSEVYGKFTKAKILTDQVQKEAIQQIQQITDSKIFAGEQIVVMPDVHCAINTCVGFTSTHRSEYIIPNIIGSDVGCGVLFIQLPFKMSQIKDKQLFFQELDAIVKHSCVAEQSSHNQHDIKIQQTIQHYNRVLGANMNYDDYIEKLKHLYNKVAAKQNKFGTLGSGNHFTELEIDKQTDNLYLVIHSGSRSLGSLFNKYYVNRALPQSNDNDNVPSSSTKYQIQVFIKCLQNEQELVNYFNNILFPEISVLHESGDQNAKLLIIAYLYDKVKQLLAQHLRDIKQPHKIREMNALLKMQHNDDQQGYLCKQYLMDDYLTEIKITQEYAQLNRMAMVADIMQSLFASLYDKHLIDIKYNFEDIQYERTIKDDKHLVIESIHNYYDFQTSIIRKGSIRSYMNQLLVIPLNMRDGILVCEGNSNESNNFSAPHGAGRQYRRKDKGVINLEQFQKEMENIYTSTATSETIDEAPQMYKQYDSIKDDILKCVNQIIFHTTPIYNFKNTKE